MTEPISERRWNELCTLAWSPVFRPPEGTLERERHDAFRDAVGEAKRLRGLARNNWMAHRALVEILAEHHVMMPAGEFGRLPKLLTDLMQWSAVTVESETCWLREELDGIRTAAEQAEAALANQLQEHRNAYLVVMQERDDARNRLRDETTVARDLLQRNVELGTRADSIEAALVDLLERLGETGEQWGVRGGGGTFAVLDEAEARWHMFDSSQPMTPVRRIVGEWRDATPRNAADRAADEQGVREGGGGE